jgi:hypothetical protein
LEQVVGCFRLQEQHLVLHCKLGKLEQLYRSNRKLALERSKLLERRSSCFGDHSSVDGRSIVHDRSSVRDHSSVPCDHSNVGDRDIRSSGDRQRLCCFR